MPEPKLEPKEDGKVVEESPVATAAVPPAPETSLHLCGCGQHASITSGKGMVSPSFASKEKGKLILVDGVKQGAISREEADKLSIKIDGSSLPEKDEQVDKKLALTVALTNDRVVTAAVSDLVDGLEKLKALASLLAVLEDDMLEDDDDLLFPSRFHFRF